jgi:MFS transporter, NNP family, nitrate/nitrite transporter
MKNNWIIPFTAVVIAMMTMQMSSLGFSPLLPAIKDEFRISYTQLGLFTGIYGLVAIVLSIPAGLLARKYGEKTILSTGLLVIAAGLLVLSRAPDFTIGLAGRIIWLVGYRLSFVCVMIAIALTAPPSLKGSTMGILGSLSSLASVIGAPFGSKIGDAFGWRGGILAYAAMAVLGFIVFLMFYRAGGRARPGELHEGGQEAKVLAAAGGRPAHREPIVWVLAATLGLLNMGGFTITFFVPAVAKTVFQLGPTDAAYIISMAYLTAALANLLCGYISDKWNRWTVLIAIAALLIPSSLGMLSANLLVFRISTALLVALGLSATNQGYAIAGAVLGGRETGPAMGIVSLGAGVYAYAGPQMLGVLRDWTGGFAAGFYAIAGFAAIGLITIFSLKRYHDRQAGIAQRQYSTA